MCILLKEEHPFYGIRVVLKQSTKTINSKIMNLKHDLNLKTRKQLRSAFQSVCFTLLLGLGTQMSFAFATAPSMEATSFMDQTTVTGTVTDSNGVPLPGANVVEKGTTNGVQTDFDGNYALNVQPGAVLVVSYIVFTATEITVGSNSVIDVVLQEDAQALDEVIVTGYGTQSKRAITGAVTTVDAEELLAVPATTFAQQLQGRAAGVTIINDATPGGEATVRIRGFGTIGNNNPLYVIDGVPSQIQAGFNPNDIETLQVLKDASAASIYGSRAANGVIIITTKKGKAGAPKITYNAYYGLQTAAEDVEALNARDLGEYLYLADYYAGKTPSHGQYGFSGSPENPQISIPNYVFPSGAATADESLYSLTPSNIYAITRSADTNWWEEVTQSNAPITNHQIQASGATENSQYAFTLNYFSQDAILKHQGYERVSIRLNSSTKTLGGKLEIGENFTVTLDNRKGGYGNDSEQNAISGAYKHHPLLPVYDISGFFAGSRGLNLGNNFNPYAILSRNQDDRVKRFRIFGNAYMKTRLFDLLDFQSSFGIDMGGIRTLDISRPQPEYVEGNFINGSTSRFRESYQWTFTNTVSYSETFNDDHDVDAYVGVESIEAFAQEFGAGRQRFPFETTDIISYLSAGNQAFSSNYGGVDTDFSLWSQFAKFNYGYKDKYLVQAIVRNDASSRFSNDANSAVFPAFSLGWRLSDESFMDGVSFIDDFKVRYGWGKTGNQEIGDYNGYAQYTANNFNFAYPIDGSSGSNTPGYGVSSFANPNAVWETTTSNNIGFDSYMFDSRLSFEFDLWNRTTSDLLLNIPPPYSAGDGGSPAFNVGEMYNEGVDINLNWSDQIGDFGYSIGGNLSAYKNEIKQLDENDTPIFGQSRRVPSLTITEVGSPISMFYGFQVEGIFQSQAEADAWPTYGSYNAPGKFKIADIDGNGSINDNDRTIIGNPHPDFVYGINLDLNYKNLSLNVFGNGSVGNEIFNYVRYFADFNTFQGNKATRALTEAWQPSNPSAPRSQWIAANPNATTPIMDANDQTSSRPSTYLIEDGSYFRLKNVQLTYDFGDAINNALGITGGQVYLQGQNLLTITDYTGANPEIQTGADTTLGYDGGFMPVSKTIILGLNLNLY